MDIRMPGRTCLPEPPPPPAQRLPSPEDLLPGGGARYRHQGSPRSKYGRAVDTAGAIARAMERAYRQGFETAQLERPVPFSKPPDAEDALDWVLIPPRPRSAFWTVCRFMLGRDGEQERDGHLVPMITERGTPGWQLVMSDGGFEKSMGEKTIVPLVRLGLLENAGDGPKQLLISNRGRAT